MITAFLINNPYFQAKKSAYPKETAQHKPEGKSPIIVGKSYRSLKNPKTPVKHYNAPVDTFWKNM